MCAQAGTNSKYLGAKTMRIYYSKRQIFNPLTGNVIQNTSGNRQSLIKQINRFRETNFFNSQVLANAEAMNLRFIAKGRPDIESNGAKVSRYYGGNNWYSVHTSTKNGLSRLNSKDAELVESQLESETGLNWDTDSVSNFVHHARGTDGFNESIALISCSKNKIWDDEEEAKKQSDRYGTDNKNRSIAWAKKNVIPPSEMKERGLFGQELETAEFWWDSRKEEYNGPDFVPVVEAKDAYTSPLFKKSVDWALNRNMPFHIMSAKHGALEPKNNIENYDLKLAQLSKAKRKEWAKEVIEDLNLTGYQSKKNRVKQVYLLGGRLYVDTLKPELEALGIETIEPLKGMSIGERLQYLKNDNEAFEELGFQEQKPPGWDDPRKGTASLETMKEEKRRDLVLKWSSPKLEKQLKRVRNQLTTTKQAQSTAEEIIRNFSRTDVLSSRNSPVIGMQVQNEFNETNGKEFDKAMKQLNKGNNKKLKQMMEKRGIDFETYQRGTRIYGEDLKKKAYVNSFTRQEAWDAAVKSALQTSEKLSKKANKLKIKERELQSAIQKNA